MGKADSGRGRDLGLLEGDRTASGKMQGASENESCGTDAEGGWSGRELAGRSRFRAVGKSCPNARRSILGFVRYWRCCQRGVASALGTPRGVKLSGRPRGARSGALSALFRRRFGEQGSPGTDPRLKLVLLAPTLTCSIGRGCTQSCD